MIVYFTQRISQGLLIAAAAIALAACSSNESPGDSAGPADPTPPDSPGNERPTVNAGPDQTVLTGSLVTVSGDASDPDGDSLTYRWSLVAEPVGASAQMTNADREEMSFRADVEGAYRFEFTANDGTTNSAVDVVTITSEEGGTSSGYSYLDDANKTAPTASGGTPSIDHHLFPRMYMHEVPADGGVTPEMVSKYQFIAAHGGGLEKVESAQQYSPATMMLRNFSARAYQSYPLKPCHVTQGIAFESTGPVSQGGPSSAGCAVYAGHWLYKAGTQLTAAITTAALTLSVHDASKVAAGQYVVIYDAPAGSFRNAEHARVLSSNPGSNTITLQLRGYKSTAASHPAGSIVAEHVLGQGSSAELWAYNTTSVSPRDGAGKTFPHFYADWLKANLMKYRDGETTAAAISGILLDADFYFELDTAAPDANNDLIRDDATDGEGENWLGEGLDSFYRMLQERLPNHYIMTGVYEARGFESAQGTEMENWLDYGNGDFKGNPEYRHLNSMISTYLYNMGSRSRGAPLVHNLTKTATNLYPGIVNPPPSSNAAVRLGLALTLMDNGYFGTHSRYTPDAWWDEYAVDVNPASASYGMAINEHSIDAVHDNRGWLGQARGSFARIYDAADFSPDESLLTNGSFDMGIDGWTAKNVSIDRVTAGALDGNGSLGVSTMNTYAEDLDGAYVKSGNVTLVAGKEYTIAFAAKASQPRTIRVWLGSELDRFTVGTEWRRYVIGFTQTKNESKPLFFYVGREDTRMELDSVHVFEGNANVFRRDFDTGIALANATSRSRTIQLGGEFVKIKGMQDPAVNDGSSVSTVTIPAYDGLLLVRPR